MHTIYLVRKLHKKVGLLKSCGAPNDSKLSITSHTPLIKANGNRIRSICKVLLSPFFSEKASCVTFGLLRMIAIPRNTFRNNFHREMQSSHVLLVSIDIVLFVNNYILC